MASAASSTLHDLLRSKSAEGGDQVKGKILLHFDEEIKKGKKIIPIVKQKYRLTSEFNKFNEIQLRDKVGYIKDQNRNVTGKNIFIYSFMKTGTY